MRLPLPRPAASSQCHPLSCDPEEDQRTGRGRRDRHRSRCTARLRSRNCARGAGRHHPRRRPTARHRVPDIRRPGRSFDWIHRRDGETGHLLRQQPGHGRCDRQLVFRVPDRQPELWDAVTGKIRTLPVYKGTEDGRTEIPLTFAPRQSWFVVFRIRIQDSGLRKQKSEIRRPRSEDRTSRR